MAISTRIGWLMVPWFLAKMFKWNVFRKIRQTLGALFSASYKAGLVGISLVTLLLGAILGSQLHLGLGMFLDAVVVVVVCGVLITLTAGLFDLFGGFVRSVPPLFFNLFGALAIVWLGLVMPMLKSPLLAIGCVLGFLLIQMFLWMAIYLLLKGKYRVASVVVVMITVTLNGWAAWWVVSPGRGGIIHEEPARTVFRDIQLADPSTPGPFPVRTLFYGSGTDRWRREYGVNADLVTEPVDATAFLPQLSGWKQTARAWYWGFDKHNLPLNGRVWMPDGVGPFPLVLVVHGNHMMGEFSDPGYGYLGELLASKGYIVVSVDQNFLNGSWSGGIGTENDARAWMLLKHLEQWAKWNSEKDNLLFGKADMDKIALVGHSRGGEAVSIAAAFNKLSYYPDDAGVRFNFDYSIRSVIAIAPSDGQYKPAGQGTPLRDVNYLVLQGNFDSDVYTFSGQKQYRRVSLESSEDIFKAAIYINRANHGQFNTVWGRSDLPFPLSVALNTAPLISLENQTKIAKVFIGAFLDETLLGMAGYRDIFKYPAEAGRWIDDFRAVAQFEEPRFSTLAGFEEDVDLTTTTWPQGKIIGTGLSIWREKNLELGPNDNVGSQVVHIGWNDLGARYTMTLPGINLQGEMGENLVLLAANTSGHSIDFSVEIEDSSGVRTRIRLSDVGDLNPPMGRTLTKSPWIEKSIYNSPAETIPQSVFFPLTMFTNKQSELDLTSVRRISLIFDVVPEGELVIETIGLGS